MPPTKETPELSSLMLTVKRHEAEIQALEKNPAIEALQRLVVNNLQALLQMYRDSKTKTQEYWIALRTIAQNGMKYFNQDKGAPTLQEIRMSLSGWRTKYTA